MNIEEVFLMLCGGGIASDMRNYISLGADINARETDGNYAIHLAVASGNVDAVGLLIDEGSDLECINGVGETPLQMSVRLRRNGPTFALLAAGADAGRIWADGRTVLHYAAERGDSHLIKKMIAGGASPDILCKSGLSPIRLAINNGHMLAFKRLLDEGADVDISSFSNDSDEVRSIVKAWQAQEWIK